MLDVLVKNGVVNLAQSDVWTREDLDDAAESFEQSEMLARYAAMCVARGCRYVDFLRSLREAAERARKVGRRDRCERAKPRWVGRLDRWRQRAWRSVNAYLSA